MQLKNSVLSVYLNAFLWPSPKVIFEIGACRGEDTGFYATTYPSARLYAFEPLPDNYRELCALIARERLANTSAYCLALSDKEGEATFNVSSGAPPEADPKAMESYPSRASSLLSPKSEKPDVLVWMRFDEQIRVETSTIDAFCLSREIKKIDFIHMDVQGAELKVLAGAARMLSRTTAIWMEVAFETTYEGQPLEADVTRWMKKRGFRKIHQVSYGPEGDALYLNMRSLLSWPRFITLRILQRLGVVRR